MQAEPGHLTHPSSNGSALPGSVFKVKTCVPLAETHGDNEIARDSIDTLFPGGVPSGNQVLHLASTPSR